MHLVEGMIRAVGMMGEDGGHSGYLAGNVEKDSPQVLACVPPRVLAHLREALDYGCDRI